MWTKDIFDVKLPPIVSKSSYADIRLMKNRSGF